MDDKWVSLTTLIVFLGLGLLATQMVRCNRDDDTLKRSVRIECIHSTRPSAECIQFGGP